MTKHEFVIQIIHFLPLWKFGGKMTTGRNKSATPPIPPPPPDFRCSVVGDAFQIGDKFCQLLRATDPKNPKINTMTLVRRGKVSGINANMDNAAAALFQKHLRQIPKEFQGYRIIFPQDFHRDGRIKLLAHETDQWYVFWVPAQGDWDNGDLLVRLVDNQHKLLINTEKANLIA